MKLLHWKNMLAAAILVGASTLIARDADAWPIEGGVTGRVHNLEFWGTDKLSLQIFDVSGKLVPLCTQAENIYYAGVIIGSSPGVTANGLKALQSAALAAFLAGKEITLFAENGTAIPSCELRVILFKDR